jgi:hypothetical protein
MRSKVTVGVVGALVLLMLPALAGAEGTCTNETIIIPDGRLVNSVIPNGSTFFFLFTGRGGNSYSAEFHGTTGAAFASPGTLVTSYSADCTTPAAGTTVTIGTDPRADFSSSRVSFTPPGTAAQQVRFSLANSSGSAVNYSFSVSDTTLFSTAWSTNGSYDSFYSLYNTTNSTCSGTLTLFNTSGTAVTTAPVTITSGATTSTNTSTLGTVRNSVGTAKLTHNCPPGAILAEAAIANFSISPTPYFQFVHFQPTRESAH